MADEDVAVVLTEVLGATPLGRLGQPERIAAVIAFVASDDAFLIAGAEINVDGGSPAR